MNYIITDSGVTIVDEDGLPVKYVKKAFYDLTYDNIIECIKDGDFESALYYMQPKTAIEKFSGGILQIRDGGIFYNGEKVHNYVAEKALKMYHDGFNINPLMNFMKNLFQNPSKQSVDSLYRFLEHNDMPITEDGFFMAYKNTRLDGYDKHSGTVLYEVGIPVKMERNKVQDDINITCSYGLHACSLAYIKNMWGHSGKNFLVKINPKDVVSVPTDYKNSKLRCCEMVPIKEVDFTSGVYEVYTKSVF